MTKEFRVIDRDEALALLRKQVDAAGADYVYTDEYPICVLAWSDEDGSNVRPACIVGRVYADLGVPVADLLNMEEIAGSEVIYVDGVEHKVDFRSEYGLEFTADAKDVLRTAQMGQDVGIPWGESVDRAEKETWSMK